MSTATTDELPSRVDRKVTNRNGDDWHEHDGEPLFSDTVLDRIRRRFSEMEHDDHEKIATVKGNSTTRTKIRTSDVNEFKTALSNAREAWIDNHGDRLTNFGNAHYGDVLTDYKVVEISEQKPRKTVVTAHYDAGYKAFMGGAEGKKQDVLLPIRDYEQWSYHTEVVEPLFEGFHEKYPY